MRRYHAEKNLIANRSRRRRNLDSAFGVSPAYAPDPGRFRKTLRCSGCTRARCQVCHPEKFPKRKPTRKEQQAQSDLKLQQEDV